MATPSAWSVTIYHFSRYCVAGGLAALVHFLVLIVLVEGFAAVPTWASAVGFCLAVIANYTLQYHWTFGAEGAHARLFSRFALFAMLALLVNTGVFWICEAALHLPYILAQAIATGTVVVINFHLNRRYVFVQQAPQ